MSEDPQPTIAETLSDAEIVAETADRLGIPVAVDDEDESRPEPAPKSEPPSEFEVGVGQREGEPWLSVRGELDVVGAAALTAAIEKVLDTGAESLVVDLAPTGFVDSSGVAALARCAHLADLSNATMRIHAPPGHQARLVMDLSGMSGPLGAFSTSR